MINDNVSVIRLELEKFDPTYTENEAKNNGIELKFDELNLVSAIRSLNGDKWLSYDENTKKHIEITYE